MKHIIDIIAGNAGRSNRPRKGAAQLKLVVDCDSPQSVRLTAPERGRHN